MGSQAAELASKGLKGHLLPSSLDSCVSWVLAGELWLNMEIPLGKKLVFAKPLRHVSVAKREVEDLRQIKLVSRSSLATRTFFTMTRFSHQSQPSLSQKPQLALQSQSMKLSLEQSRTYTPASVSVGSCTEASSMLLKTSGLYSL
jgi:hypothetical protein